MSNEGEEAEQTLLASDTMSKLEKRVQQKSISFEPCLGQLLATKQARTFSGGIAFQTILNKKVGETTGYITAKKAYRRKQQEMFCLWCARIWYLHYPRVIAAVITNEQCPQFFHFESLKGCMGNKFQDCCCTD